MTMISHAVETISRYGIRLFPFLTAGCVLIFPAYKGVWPGYVPIVAGILFTGFFISRFDELARYISARTTRWLGIALYVLPAVVQVALIWVIQSEPTYDGLYVFRHAETLLNTGRMDPMTYYPPAQTWWYALWFKLFGVSPEVAQLSHIPFSIGITWSVYRMGKLIGGEVSARLVALGVAWYPSFLGYVLTTPYYHYLYTLLTLWLVWGLVKAATINIQRSTSSVQHSTCDIRVWMYWGMAGLAAGLGALTKATQLIAPLQVVAWTVVTACALAIPWRKWLVGLVVFCAGMLLVVGPWTLRNWMVFEDLVPVCTSGGLVLYSANNPGSNGLYSGIPDAVDLDTPAQMLAHSRWCSEQAKAFMMEHPRAFMRLAWIKFLHTWGIEATFADLINRGGKPCIQTEHVFTFLFFSGWAALVGAWLRKSFLQIRHHTPLSAFEILAGVLILSNAVVYVVFEGGDRHHLPLVPLILLLLIPSIPNARSTNSDNE